MIQEQGSGCSDRTVRPGLAPAAQGVARQAPADGRSNFSLSEPLWTTMHARLQGPSLTDGYAKSVGYTEKRDLSSVSSSGSCMKLAEDARDGSEVAIKLMSRGPGVRSAQIPVHVEIAAVDTAPAQCPAPVHLR
jgi:hypothetical protein